MRRRFFVEAFDAGHAVLAGDAAHHVGRVLRAEPGQLYELSDGTSVWHENIGRMSGAPVTYELDGKQYLLVSGGNTLYAYALQ